MDLQILGRMPRYSSPQHPRWSCSAGSLRSRSQSCLSAHVGLQLKHGEWPLKSETTIMEATVMEKT